MSQCLQVALCRIQIPELKDNTRIMIEIQKQGQIFASSVVSVKNGSANFYRQTFDIPVKLAKFYIKVIKVQTNRIFGILPVQRQIVQQIDYRKNVFSTCFQSIKVFWEAQRVYQNCDKDEGITCRDQIDFNVWPSPQTYQNNLQSQLKSQRNRKSSLNIRKRSQTSYEHECLEKSIQMTTNTTGMLKKFSQKLDNIRRQPFQLSQQKDQVLQEQAKQKHQGKRIKQSQKQLQIIKNNKKQPPKQRMMLSTIKSQSNLQQLIEKDAKKSLSQSRHSMLAKSSSQSSFGNHNQIQLKRSKSGIFSKITLKRLISTAVFGLVSGLAATQV